MRTAALGRFVRLIVVLGLGLSSCGGDMSSSSVGSGGAGIAAGSGGAGGTTAAAGGAAGSTGGTTTSAGGAGGSTGGATADAGPDACPIIPCPYPGFDLVTCRCRTPDLPDARPDADASAEGGAPNADSGDASSGGPCGFTNVVSKAYFDKIFPLASRHALYTYEGLVDAIAKYPAFVNTGTLETCRTEAAAFFANVAQESGRLRYAEQIAKDPYCSTKTGCVCDPNTQDQTKWYYGRGPIQLSWNYNYCSAGTALGRDLLSNPNVVSTVPAVAWETALWFWMTSTGAGNATCHQSITSGGVFGETIRTINGALECDKGGYDSNAAVKARVDWYIQFATDLGIAAPGSPTDIDC